MRTITYPPKLANLNAAARIVCSYLAHLYADARGSFDADAAVRLMLVAYVEAGTLTTPEGDEFLEKLLSELQRVQAERQQAKGGAA